MLKLDFERVGEASNSNTDLRSTIHWEPSLSTDRDGRANLSFYSADLQGLYRVVVNGMALDGRVFRGEYEIKIENP